MTFSKNKISHLKKYEPKCYWRDVGSISSYWQANMDLLGEKPVFGSVRKDPYNNTKQTDKNSFPADL